MAYTEGIKGSAINLRRKGQSYKEISASLGIAKSTASLWCRNVPLNDVARSLLHEKKEAGMRRGFNALQINRLMRIAAIKDSAAQEITMPDEASFKLLGAMLYWAEGDKTKRFGITNSDPLLIKFAVEWMKKVFEIGPDRLRVQMNIYPQQNEKMVKSFWSKLTGIPLENFRKSFVKPESSGYKKNKLYHGTIKIRLTKGTDARHRVFGWIESLLKNLDIDKMK